MDEGKRFTIISNYDSQTIDLGASIAHDGVCLTVVGKSADKGDPWYQIEAWEEALRLSTLGDWKVGQKINLERSLKMGDELGGHLVSGHVDGKVEIIEMRQEGEATRFSLRVPEELAKFIAPKGSVTLNGASLTVNNVEQSEFDVLLIKHTLEVTTWGLVEVGDAINLEVDQMARYAARLLEYK